MPASTAAIVIAVLTAALAVVPAAGAAKTRRVAYVADGRLAEWRGTPTYLAGRAQVSRGELIYTDYLYGLRLDRAYWVSGLEVRAPNTSEASGAVEATTLARGGHERALTRRRTTVAPAGGLSPALLTEQRVVEGARIEPRNGFRARLRNLTAVRFDTAEMGLDPRREVVAQLRGDGETAITLAGRFPRGTKAFLDGKPLTLRRSRRAVRVAVELTDADPHTLRVGRR